MLSAEQLELRRTGIGSSDIAAIVGQSPFCTPFDVWLSKVERLEQHTDFSRELGDLLEGSVLTLYERRVGPRKLIRSPGTVRGRNPIVLSTPDGYADFGDSSRIVEAKTARFGKDWGEEGTDEIPAHYVIQATWHMLADSSRSDRCDVPVLIRTDEFRVYRVLWDAQLAGVLLQEAERFWKDYVEAKVPPSMEGSRKIDGWLRQRFPKDTGKEIDADEEAAALAENLMESEGQLQSWKRKTDALIAQLKLKMEDAAVMRGPFGELIWRQNKPSAVTDWEAIAEVLLAQLPKKQQQNILSNHTTTRPGNRPFNKKWGTR